MGQPKKQRRKYSTPKHMFKGREGEKELVSAYGLKNSKELWKAKSEVGRLRSLARQLLAKPDEKVSSDLIGKLKRLGLLDKEAKLEDVLKITTENILDRRFQTIVFKRNLTTSIKQARQEIVHGHISIAGQRMTAPGHLTMLEEAEQLDFYAGSPLKDPEHPIRKVEKKASTEAKGKEAAEASKAAPKEQAKKGIIGEEAEGAMEEEVEEGVEAPEEEAPEEVKKEVQEAPEKPVEAPKTEDQ